VNDRERTLAILNYRGYDRLPIVHFGYWNETLDKWAAEGHITPQQARMWADGNAADAEIAARLGFDFNWSSCFGLNTNLLPAFEEQVLEQLPDGSRKVLNMYGVVIIQKDGAFGIPPEVDHLLKGRKEWEEHFLPRLQFTAERATIALGTADYLRKGAWTEPYGVWCGSLYGAIRDWVGMINLAYLQADDPALFDEMIETVGELCYQCVKAAVETGARFDFGHFWEDICFKSGPLVNPRAFRAKVGPHYKRITGLLREHGVTLVSLDCDGLIDALLPVWLENGVNVMFPIEVGTWNASLAPWREKYGRELRGVGGMDKRVFARDYAAVDAEVERLKPLVDLGGYIPCPDHRIAPDAKWENVQYYCDKMRKTFG
jgi:uroporphyrinogen decarboxylase